MAGNSIWGAVICISHHIRETFSPETNAAAYEALFASL